VEQPVAKAAARPRKAAPRPTGPVSPASPAKKAAGTAKKAAGTTKKRAVPAPAWVEPVGDVCPPSHPVKAKLTSRLYHLPGMFAYTRTRPDRCYGTEAAALADGLTKAKR
jgi:micrococcal nuclease